MKKYNPKSIEAKWQKYWQANKTFHALDGGRKRKKFVLVEFPYPSGAGLHMGHMRGYTAGDVTSRYWRLKGEDVLFPIGWDAFGLPAENYAIKTGVHPKVSTAKNISNFVKQINSLGYSFDWSRVVDTTDPNYYKWTQWIFLQLYKAGLAYESTAPINWCPKDKTGLANEEVINGACERCGTLVEKKELRQWYLKITAYAEKLLAGLKHLPEWPEQVKLQQENWIGKSTGAEIEFAIQNSEVKIKVFTTRPDTIFGATYLVIAPEHELVQKLKDKVTNYTEVFKYVTASEKEDEIKRTDVNKEKTGVELLGLKAVNPATKEEIPVWVADYVLGHYGTGAIMAVPAHDDRDFAFAKKFRLPIRQVVAPAVVDHRNPPQKGKKDTVRNVVLVVLFDPKQNKYLTLSWKKQPWKTFITGGVEDGETIEQAALREIKEETGFTGIKFTRVLGESQSKFFAAHKDVNRTAYVTSVLCELTSSARSKVSTAEENNYDLVWLSKSEVEGASLQHAEFGFLWERIARDIPYLGSGVLVHSGEFTGQDSEMALPALAKKFGRPKVQYKLRDWVFSRQRYWGEPIPIVHCAVCALKKVKTKSEPEIYFADQKIWASIIRGYKVVETRSFDTKGENASWAKIAAGDTISLYNKKTKQRAVATVEEVRRFKNFLELYKASDWLAATFPGQTFKSPIAVELAYKKIYRGYSEQVARYGLTAWKISVRTAPVAVKETDLPLKLPEVKKYEPTGTGESPLALVTNWVNTTCPNCKAPARRETNTMPQWAGSSWYWLRYADPKNKREFASKAKLKTWTPVDIYFGGMEHTTLHLLYSRFWNQFLFDKKCVTSSEPYTKRVPHGIILAADGEKMSKSRGNVVNPDDIVKKHGADAARMYELFLGPHDAQVAWSDQGVIGVRRFLDRVWSLGQVVISDKTKKKDSEKVERLLHKLIKKVGEDVQAQRFNTCVSSLMEFLNEVKDESVGRQSFMSLLIVLYPFAPHIAEELHAALGGKGSLQRAQWPKYDAKKIVDTTVEFVVQVNGKLRDKLQLPVGASETKATEAALASSTVRAALGAAQIKRVIFVPNKLINIVA